MGILVFVSYATVDSQSFCIAEIAKKLTEFSEIDNVLYWEEHMNDDIFKYMNDNLGKCDVLLLFCSPSAVASESVQMEWMSALKLKKAVVPVFKNPDDIPPLLTTKLGIHLNTEDLENTVKSLYNLVLKKYQATQILEPGNGNPIQEVPIPAKTEGMPLDELTKMVSAAIFNQQKSLTFNDKEYPVEEYKKSGVRYVEINSYKFMEQNPKKSSKYARMAKEGKHIVWVMKHNRFYALLVEEDFSYL